MDTCATSIKNTLLLVAIAPSKSHMDGDEIINEIIESVCRAEEAEVFLLVINGPR